MTCFAMHHRTVITIPSFVFLCALLASATTKSVKAAPGVCDRLCKNVEKYYDCGVGSWVETRYPDCTACSNINKTECVDGLNVLCLPEPQPKLSQAFRAYPNGTKSICNCNPGILFIEATKMEGTPTPWTDTSYSICSKIPPGGGGGGVE